MPRHMKVRELMSTEVITLTEDESVAHAQNCMTRGRVRHLPVVRDGRLVGLMTHRDVLAASFSFFADVDPSEQRRVFTTILVKEVMHRDLLTVGPDATVSEAAQILLRNKYGCLPVVDAVGNLLGILTESDFLRLTVRLLP